MVPRIKSFCVRESPVTLDENGILRRNSNYRDPFNDDMIVVERIDMGIPYYYLRKN